MKIRLLCFLAAGLMFTGARALDDKASTACRKALEALLLLSSNGIGSPMLISQIEQKCPESVQELAKVYDENTWKLNDKDYAEIKIDGDELLIYLFYNGKNAKQLRNKNYAAIKCDCATCDQLLTEFLHEEWYANAAQLADAYTKIKEIIRNSRLFRDGNIGTKIYVLSKNPVTDMPDAKQWCNEYPALMLHLYLPKSLREHDLENSGFRRWCTGTPSYCPQCDGGQGVY